MVDQTPAPSNIHDTSKAMQDPAEQLLLLAVGMSNHGDASEYIEAQEKAGQRQLVNSDRLPVRGSDDPEFLTLGFTFGEPDPHDELFRPATLPAGWNRQGSDHAMWSHIVDQLGRKRVAIFYKAAFYDRSADMYLETPVGYLRSCLWNDERPVLDDAWLTSTVVAETIEALARQSDERAQEADNLIATRSDLDVKHWSGRAAEHRAEAAKARALAESLS